MKKNNNNITKCLVPVRQNDLKIILIKFIIDIYLFLVTALRVDKLILFMLNFVLLLKIFFWIRRHSSMRKMIFFCANVR
jgi:hypothetical protein